MADENIGVKIGGFEKENIPVVTDAIIKIMEAKVDQETIRTALATFTDMAKTKNVTISDCTFNGGKLQDSEGSNLKLEIAEFLLKKIAGN